MALLSGAGRVAARLFPGGAELVGVQQQEIPQKDELCGPFWGAVVLRALGAGGAPADLDQDAVARRAGTTLAPRGSVSSRPPGEPRRTDYRLSLPRSATLSASGTSAGGLLRSIEELSDGALAVVPVSGPWDTGPLRELLARLDAHRSPLACVANLSTGRLWSSHTSESEAFAYLTAGDGGGPSSEWHVGHFVAVVGLIPGRQGALVVVADSYRSLGVDGLHLQPVERVADALGRGARSRGLLLVTAAGDRDQLAAAVAGSGLTVGLWDNGSLERPPGPAVHTRLASRR